MPFPESFLDDLRARVPVSEVVRDRVQLKKKGSEYVGLSPFHQEKTPSFTVNDEKQFFHDFSSGKHGDVFAFLVETEGVTFPEAVERVAKIAGVAVPDTERRRTNGASSHVPGGNVEGELAANGADVVAHGAADDGGRGQPRQGRRDITAAYDYTDPQGSLIYQVCRIQGTNDNGKPYKTFLQRRPAPADGHWIWGLGAGEYVQTRSGDWYQLTKDREKWSGPRATFEGVEHTLYRLVELREADPDEPIHICEGEKDVETLVAWGFTATTNSGGAKHWRPEHAEFFRGRDVVIAIDNDDPGRERAGIVGRSLRGIAARVRVLDITAAWPDAPKGADVTDWKRQREGSPEELREIVERLPDWSPPPRHSKFGLVMWSEQDQPGEEYEYLVEDLIPEREAVLIFGETQSGKSFWTMGMGLAGAAGTTFNGRRIMEPFGVVYCAYESGKGYRARMKAHRKALGLGLELPFAVLTKPIDLWSDAINTQALIDEIRWLVDERFRGVRLGTVVIDTHNAATPGASEIDSKEVSLIRERYRAIMAALGCGLWIVSHKNASGKHRGNEQLYNNIDTAIDISKRIKIVDRQPYPERDALGRQLRTARVVKQREGEDGAAWDFVLASETVGTNKYGRPRTSCVAIPVMTVSQADATDTSQQAMAANPNPGILLNSERATILRALKTAIENHGQPTPAGLELPKSISKVVDARHWRAEYLKIAPDADTASGETINKRLRRASEKFQEERIIGRNNPWVWPTGRPVKNVIGPAARNENPYPGRPEPAVPEDIEDLF